MYTGKVLNVSKGSLRFLFLLGLGSAVGCSASWLNTRTIYLRNQTAADLLLTWKIPCANLVPPEHSQQGPGAALMESGGIPPHLECSPSDTLLDNYEQTLLVHSHLVAGDSIALMVKIAPGTSYLLSNHIESFHHSDPDQHSMGGFTFLPCTIQWTTAGGQLQHRSIHPLAWRKEQDQEADRKWTSSYNLVRYIDYN